MPTLVDVPEKYVTTIDGAYEYVLTSQPWRGNIADLIAMPIKNNPIDNIIDKDKVLFVIICDISDILRVPVFAYNIPIASSINTAPILPINRYWIAATDECL